MMLQYGWTSKIYQVKEMSHKTHNVWFPSYAVSRIGRPGAQFGFSVSNGNNPLGFGTNKCVETKIRSVDTWARGMEWELSEYEHERVYWGNLLD